MPLIHLKTTAHYQCLDITAQVRRAVRESGIREGICQVMALIDSLGLAKPDPRLSQGRSCSPLKPHRKESDRAWPVRFRNRGGSGEVVRAAAPPM